MKVNHIYKKILSLLLFLAIAGCSHFEEMNQNPSTSTDMDPNFMLPTIQLQLSGGKHEQVRNGFIYSGNWMQHWAGEWASTEYGGKGKKNDGYMSALWEAQYPREVKNVVDMVKRTTDDETRTNINSASRIMKVYIFSRLTDLYGDLPYFEAGTGYYDKIFSPKYDAQKEIYYHFFMELDEAVKAMDATKDPITQDYYFNGDINKWKKFGNSLRLRLAMRLTKVEPEKAKTEAEAAIALGVMASNDDNVVMRHNTVPSVGEVNGANGVSEAFMDTGLGESVYRISTTFAETLENTSDPRITMYARNYIKDENRTDITKEVYEYFGSYKEMGVLPSRFIYEATGGPIPIKISGKDTLITRAYQLMQPSKNISARNAPFIVMSYAEVELWKAEAAFRGWATGGSTETHFENALHAGVGQMTVYGIPAASPVEINKFISANPLTPGTELQQINQQLWINFALNGQEAYANWRRSGLPELAYPNPSPGENQSNGEIPRRMQYPINEYLMNGENVAEAVARIPGGVDDWTARVWWDKQ